MNVALNSQEILFFSDFHLTCNAGKQYKYFIEPEVVSGVHSAAFEQNNAKMKEERTMITDYYLNDAIGAVEDAKKALDDEITRLKTQHVDTTNLEHVEHLLKKVDSFLVRIKEAFS